jgi:hypothetical protein
VNKMFIWGNGMITNRINADRDVLNYSLGNS